MGVHVGTGVSVGVGLGGNVGVGVGVDVGVGEGASVTTAVAVLPPVSATSAPGVPPFPPASDLSHVALGLALGAELGVATGDSGSGCTRNASAISTAKPNTTARRKRAEPKADPDSRPWPPL